MAGITNADTIALNGTKKLAVDKTGGVLTNGDTALLYSKNEYAEALTRLLDFAWGDTKDAVFGADLASKMVQSALGVGAVIGNMVGGMAASKGKAPAFMGLYI